MRDWASTLRPASYRGVSFYVESEEYSGGKRIAAHEYAGGRTTFLEEMGLKTGNYSVTAYLLGDVSDVKGLLLQAACLASGPGLLVLPMDIPQLAYVEGFRRSRERDKRGWVAFDFQAIPISNEVLPSLGIVDVSTAVLTGLSVAASAFGKLF